MMSQAMHAQGDAQDDDKVGKNMRALQARGLWTGSYLHQQGLHGQHCPPEGCPL